ncbi:MAG TPA: glycosyltransferase family 1 protein [Burkholderiales bacterium]|jgi:glycosyltransferase involved in cell wall biosynthesis|nr:glycosyltransferase family 1 protein [Burkholderiales bacterium]
MHIAMVTETYPPEVNGVARTVALMAEGLCALGHTVQLIRPRQGRSDHAQRATGYDELLCAGLPIPRYTQLKMGLPSGRALARAWRERRPDVVHIATEGPLGWSALAAARRLGLPVATDFHTNFHAYSRHYGVPWLARPVTAVLRRFHNRADCTMVPTDEMAEDLGRLGFERLRVVGRGVNAGTFSPDRRRPALRSRWGAAADDLVALCVSRFAPEKNFPLVLEAYAAMRRANPSVKLVLVGDGPLEQELRAANTGSVIAGRLVNGELSAHYASADVFLFPSVTETFGNVTLEAMASGLAVVAYRYAAARQHIEDGVSGLLAEPGDRTGFIGHAVSLACEPQRARELGRAARIAAAPVSWERITADFDAVLRDTALAHAARRESAHAAA